MNELELLRGWRAEVPAPDPIQLETGRARLLTVIAGQGARRMRPSSRRFESRPPVKLAVALAAALVCAAGLIVSVLDRPGAVPGQRIGLAAQILQRAADVRGQSTAASAASPRQWIYQYMVDEGFRQATQRSGAWERFDGRRTASIVDGRLVVYREHDVHSPSGNPLRAYLRDPTPQAVYAAIASLPSDPRRLLAAVNRAMNQGYDSAGLPALDVLPSRTVGEREFEFIAQLLWQDSQSGVVHGGGSLFRALARLPGVSAQRGIRDALGRRAVGISDDRGAFQLLLSPRTYQVLGFRSVSTGTAPHLPGGDTAPRGTVVQSIANREKFVPAPGDT